MEKGGSYRLYSGIKNKQITFQSLNSKTEQATSCHIRDTTIVTTICHIESSV